MPQLLPAGPKIVLMDREYSLDDLADDGDLDLRNIGGIAWEAILSICKSKRLRLYHVKIPSLSGVERLRDTSRLSMVWANQISSLDSVFQMTWLTSLSVSDFRLLKSIEGIGKLECLESLHLSGNLGSLSPPLRMDSIRPISALQNLRELTVQNVRLENDDITFLAQLPKLNRLVLSSTFDWKQFAFLAKRLNGQLEVPITASTKMKMPCRSCGGSLSLFIGKRRPLLCESCDRKRFEKLTRQFEEQVAVS